MNRMEVRRDPNHFSSELELRINEAIQVVSQNLPKSDARNALYLREIKDRLENIKGIMRLLHG